MSRFQLLFLYTFIRIRPPPCLDNVRIPAILSMYFHWNIPYPCLDNIRIPVKWFLYFHRNIGLCTFIGIPPPCLDNVRILVTLSMCFHWNIPHSCFNNVCIEPTFGHWNRLELPEMTSISGPQIGPCWIF